MIKKFKIPRNRWSASQLENLRKNFKGLDGLDDSVLQKASLGGEEATN